jgi:hypothetical protein
MTRAIADFALLAFSSNHSSFSGHGLAQTAAANEMRSLPSIDAFCLQNTECHSGYPNGSGGLLVQSRLFYGNKP